MAASPSSMGSHFTRPAQTIVKALVQFKNMLESLIAASYFSVSVGGQGIKVEGVIYKVPRSLALIHRSISELENRVLFDSLIDRSLREIKGLLKDKVDASMVRDEYTALCYRLLCDSIDMYQNNKKDKKNAAHSAERLLNVLPIIVVLVGLLKRLQEIGKVKQANAISGLMQRKNSDDVLDVSFCNLDVAEAFAIVDLLAGSSIKILKLDGNALLASSAAELFQKISEYGNLQAVSYEDIMISSEQKKKLLNISMSDSKAPKLIGILSFNDVLLEDTDTATKTESFVSLSSNASRFMPTDPSVTPPPTLDTVSSTPSPAG